MLIVYFRVVYCSMLGHMRFYLEKEFNPLKVQRSLQRGISPRILFYPQTPYFGLIPNPLFAQTCRG